MLQLEQLYNCARDHLEQGAPNWDTFARTFKEIFSADLLFYRVQNDELGWQESSLKIITTTHPTVVDMYIENGFHRRPRMKESDLPSLEPTRRTDEVSDDEFRKLGDFYEFFAGNGLFYLMLVPARLEDNTDLNLMVWRDEQSGDFDEQEKMRLGLFMRYLMKTVDTSKLVHGETGSELQQFAKTFGLTGKEAEVLSYLPEGYSLRGIAKETGRTYSTIRWHVENLFQKCHVKSQKNLLRQFYALIKN